MKRREMPGMMRALPVALSAILATVLSQPLGAQSLSLSPGAIFRDCADCPEMVVIPDGKFQMGSDRREQMREGLRPEGPIRAVTISKSFAAGRFEVTNAQYAAFVEATGYSATNGCVASGGRDPVDGVTWRNPGIGSDVADDDGWAFLGDVGNLLQKKQPNFDARNYGFEKLGKLVRSLDFVEIDEKKSDDESSIVHIYVRIKNA